MTPDPAFIKICGITRLTDALHAVHHGATALGFVFWPHSPRYVTPERAAEIIAELPPTMTAVGVFVNEPVDSVRAVVARSGIGAVQLHGEEPPSYADALGWPVLRALAVADVDAACETWPQDITFLLDTIDPVRRGGTGETVDWTKAAALARTRRVILAGGLTPVNVADAISAVRPYGVDVSSGVEDSPGVKSVDKMARFLENARHAFEERSEGR
jgi:phosphoribosylanthranilate isomerase